MGPSCIKGPFFVIDLMTCYVHHIKLTRRSVNSNLVSKLIIHIATISIIWVLFLTNGHTLVPYFLKLPKHGCNTHSNKLTKQNKQKACDPLKHQTSHTYKNICALTMMKTKCFNSDTQTVCFAVSKWLQVMSPPHVHIQ